eukprot:CCRYP_000472-RB/>CCRYP_000472-RB protein AED:0.04 eAED:0.04 QI:239/1/1/1/1/1/5/608/1378
MASHYIDPYMDGGDDEEEEEECRVCRGPAEEGRPLFKPCKCSGSIGLTHQDCLTSWLDVTRGDGKCELCSTRFKFAPQYAPGTPDTLPPREVFVRLLRRAGAKWLPFAIRVVFAASLWLMVLPLGTSYIYHGWMVRPAAVVERWEWELIKRDIVGGAVIAIIIVVSFLSLMSFAEFLRFQWGGEGAGAAEGGVGQQQQQQRRRNGGENNPRGGGAGLGVAPAVVVDGPIEGDIEDIVLPHVEFKEDFRRKDSNEEDDSHANSNSIAFALERSGDGLHRHIRTINDESLSRLDMADRLDAIDYNRNNYSNAWRTRHGLEPMEDSDFDPGYRNRRALNPNFDAEHSAYNGSDDDDDELRADNHAAAHNDAEDQFEAFLRAQEEQDLEQQAQMEDGMPPLEEDANFRQNRRPRDDARFEPQFEPLQPAFGLDQDDADDGMDMEINLALDELLGFRGPVLAVVRNLLWLLVFNTAYLGVFALLPSSFGASMFTLSSRLSVVHKVFEALPGSQTVANISVALNEKSKETNLIFQPSDIGQICLGYFTFACIVFFMQIVSIITNPKRADAREQLDGADVDVEAGRKKFISLINCAAAIVKVVVLLFIKMLILPLSLGLCLDVATLPLFKKTLDDRISFAGIDLFGSLFLHWVTGITFMLLVTVSVLQLREVAHPDILARVIRPQEPQPDLLGNLLQETAVTHTKRILLSLGIYAALLSIHIWLPSRILMAYNLFELLPFFKPKYWHIFMPQIQIPAELFLFHLCMLSVLEKYKNNIGGLQHHWLHFLGNLLGITDQILPKEVDKFVCVGTIPVFANDMVSYSAGFKDEEQPKLKTGIRSNILDPFWNELISESDPLKRESIIQCRLRGVDQPRRPVFEEGEVRRDGKKVLSPNAFIRFPSASSDVIKRVMKTPNDTSSLLPTCIGRYRLKQRITRIPIISPDCNNRMPKVTCTPVIEIYQEVAGNLIPRPPEGWDDLGVGGAESQGRWAWGDEHLSGIEASVAARTPFFDESIERKPWAISCIKFASKMMTLLLISWVAITFLLIAALNSPLCIGRFVLYLLRVPERCVHDPLAFAIGVAFLIPLIGSIAKIAATKPVRPLSWIRSFTPNESRPKTTILLSFLLQWFVMCPLLLGFLYGSFFAGLARVWQIPDTQINIQGWLVSWATGTLLLNSWAIMCYFRVFTKRFWSDIAMGDIQPNANGNQDAGEGQRQRVNDAAGNNVRHEGVSQIARSDKGNTLSWQGEDGAIGRCFKVLLTFVAGWEWDKLDRKAMLQDCVEPIFRQLLVSCLLPSIVTLLVSFFYYTTVAKTSQPILLLGGTEEPLSATLLFRMLAIATAVTQLLRSCKNSLQRWFEAAHKIARDDRYLIGEILLNYSPPQRSTIS